MVIGAMVALVIAGTGRAQLLLYDGFDYPVDQALQDQSGWSASGSGAGISIVSGNIASDGILAPTGNQLSLASNGLTATRSFASQTTDVYASFSFKIASLGSLDEAGAIIAGFQQTGTGTAANLWLRKNGSNIDIGANVGGASPVTYNSNGSGWSTDSSFFIVVQYDFNDSSPTNDAVNVWILPNTATNSSEIPDFLSGPWGSGIQVSGGPDRDFLDGFYLQQAPNGPNLLFDELRIGSSWADVTPVAAIPEPSTYALLAGTAMLGAYLWFHRSRVCRTAEYRGSGR